MRTSDAIAHFGSAPKLAQALGLKSRQAIYRWGKKVPELYQYKLQVLTRGQLKVSLPPESPRPTQQ